MYIYFLKKIAAFLFSLYMVATLTFLLMMLAPGDPFAQDQPLPEEILKAMQAHYGLDQPWYIQYARYLKGIVTGNLGPSFTYQGRTVNEIIKDGFPISVILGAESLTLAIGSGLILGTIAAFKRSKWQDSLAMVVAVLGISIPNFIFASFLQFFLAMKLDLLPVARWGGFSHTILPALSLAALPTAFIARLMRSNMVEVLAQDYIKTAQSKGLSSFQVIFRHSLRNAILPIASYIGSLAASILTGSFVIERIFGIPGLGQWFVLSVLNRDYTVILGLAIFYSTLLMCCVLFIDFLYTLIDPRIEVRYGKR